MTDSELLKLAAKAAEMVFGDSVGEYSMRNIYGCVMPARRNANGTDTAWNPLTDDGDALRLAVKLKLDLGFYAKESDGTSICVIYPVPEPEWCETLCEDYGNDPYAATRRAIVRAAAKIGKEMK